MTINILKLASELKSVALLSTIFEAFLQAIYTCVFVAVAHHQLCRARRMNHVALGASSLLYCFVTVHWVLGIVQLCHAFIDNGHTVVGPALYYVNVRDALALARVTLYVACTVVIDLLLIYRLYMVYERSLLVTIPPALAVGGITGCFGVQMTIFVDGTLQDVLPGGHAAPWIMSTYALSFVTSFYPSALIAYSIIRNGWKISQSTLATSFLLPVAYTVVESACFYSILTAVVLALYVKEDPSLFAVVGINPACIGINFSLILLRISHLSAQQSRTCSTPALTCSFRNPVSRHSAAHTPIAFGRASEVGSTKLTKEAATLPKRGSLQTHHSD